MLATLVERERAAVAAVLLAIVSRSQEITVAPGLPGKSGGGTGELNRSDHRKRMRVRGSQGSSQHTDGAYNVRFVEQGPLLGSR